MFAVLFLPLGICGFQNAVSQNYYGVSAEQNAVSAEQNGVLQSCDNQIVFGAERMTEYLPEIKGKKVGIVANQTSVVFDNKGKKVHLVDTLLASGIKIECIFSPEHGFRGNAEAGAMISSGKDPETGIDVVSLYGKNKKPTPEQTKRCDVILFDLQDVGCRFYTYISTLTYVMQACSEANIPLIVLDRPNPNDYIDGPVMEDKYKSFVGLHNIPVVYGLTIGEYALMVNNEGWLEGGMKCDLRIIGLQNWFHDMPSAYSLPVAPSPNLPTDKAIALYPSLCLLEGTTVSVGRGTDTPFEIIGSPDCQGKDFTFVPRPIKGVSENPPHKGKVCYGENNLEIPQKQLSLRYIIEMYKCSENKEGFFNPFFDKLAGTNRLRQQIEEGWSEDKIRSSWSEDLEKYKKIREKYLIYQRK